jgi:hypothetical protein
MCERVRMKRRKTGPGERVLWWAKDRGWALEGEAGNGDEDEVEDEDEASGESCDLRAPYIYSGGWRRAMAEGSCWRGEVR